MPPFRDRQWWVALRRRAWRALRALRSLLSRLGALTAVLWKETKAVLATAGCAALVTVTVGGVIGNSIVVCAQRRSKAEELAQLKRNKAAELALQAENQCAKDRFLEVIEVYDLVFRTATTGEKYLGKLRSWRIGEGAEQHGRREVQAARENFRAAYEEWARSKETADIALGFYFPQNRRVEEAWDGADRAVESFLQCVGKLAPVKGETPEDPCSDEYAEVQRRLSVFGQVVELSWSEACPVPGLPDSLREAGAEEGDNQPAGGPSGDIVSCLRETLGLR